MRTVHFAVLAAASILTAVACPAATWQAVVPDADTEGWRELARDWLQAAGQPAPTVRTASGLLGNRTAVALGTRLVVFGHAGNNALLARWYARGLDSTDLKYPGPGGYVLRPLSRTEETLAPIVIAGAVTPADLAPAKDEFVRLTKAEPPALVVKLGGNWPAVAAQEQQWWQKLLAVPVLGDRQDADHMRWYFSAQMQPLEQPEATTWPVWMQRMIALAGRAAEGVHATGTADAQALLKRVLQNLVAHLPPNEIAEPGQKNPGDWMGEYYWPALMFALLQSRSCLDGDPGLAQAVDRAVYTSAAGWLQTTIYRAAFLGQTSHPAVFGSRHEVADLYGWYLTAAYLLNSSQLSQAERDTVREWLGNCDRYFAMADPAILCDDNAINYDDADMIAAWWLDRGRQQAVTAGGAEWTARYLIGHVDNTNRVASWGYEYATGPASSHLASPLRKIALLANQPGWLAWSQRWWRPSGDISFWLPRNTTLSGSPWGPVHDFRWTLAAQSPLTDESALSAASGLQVLWLPAARAQAVGAAPGDRVLHSVCARLGTRAKDPHAVMMGHNGLYFENAVAGAMVHFSAGGQCWLRGAVDDVMATTHNRAYLGDAAEQQTRHALKLTWQHQDTDWAGWEVQETLSDRQWQRLTVLFRAGTLLTIDRVQQTGGQARPWLTTWMPLESPRREGPAWVVRQGPQQLWLLTDRAQELQLTGMGETVDKRPVPGGPWLLRGLAVGAQAAEAPRYTLLSVGALDGQAPVLQSDAQGCVVRLADGGPTWRVALSPQGATVAASQSPITATGGRATTTPVADTVPVTSDPRAVFKALGARAAPVIKGEPGASLLAQEVQWLRSDAPVTLRLPATMAVRAVEVRRWGSQRGQLSVTTSAAGGATETQALELDSSWLINGWKGYSEAAQMGRASFTGAVDVVQIMPTPDSGHGKILVRVFGRPAAPVVSSPWQHLVVWPQPGSPCVVAVDQRSRLRVFDTGGRELWVREPPAADCLGLAASTDRLAVLQSNEQVVVLNPQGREIWHAALDKITKTGFGNVPFRALWSDVTGDGVADLLVAQFCFECALDGRDGKLLGQSEFVPSFWPQLVAAANGQLWSAPAYSAALRVWQPPQGGTRYLCANTVSPRTGGNVLALRGVGGRLVAVREQMACSLSRPGIPESFSLEDATDWLWNAPDPLTAAGISPQGTVAVADLFGSVRLLNARGQETARAQLPQPLAGLEAVGATRWLAVGRTGEAWVLDERLHPLVRYVKPAQPWQQLVGHGATGLAVIGADVWMRQ